jgi:hypothetical protein
MTDSDRVLELLSQAKRVAKEYYQLTGKPLGITGEVAEYEVARLLGVTLTPARQAGYDAIELVGDKLRTYQVKGRYLPKGCTPGQRLGSLQTGKKWDAVLMVLLDAEYNATEIWEADRDPVISELTRPGSKARNERGALGVTKFKSISRLRWSMSGREHR